MLVQFLGWEETLEGGHGNLLQQSSLENPMDRGAWKATVQSVAKSWTWLKWHGTYAHRFTNTRPYTFLNISQIFFTVILFKAVSGIQVLRLFCPYYCSVTSILSNSVRPHRRQLTRFPCSWDSPGKNTGVGCHFLLDAWKWKVKGKSLRHVRLFTTPWTAAHQPPPPMGFPRQEYCSGVPLPSPTEPAGKPNNH